MNTIDVYKEEDLLKTINGKFIVEAYRCKRIGSTVIGLCKNSSPMFCRQENDIPETECSWIQVLNNQSSILKHDGQEIEYNSICPKIAWGITAYLLFYSDKDDRGDIYFEINDEAVEEQILFDSYFSLNENKYKTDNKKRHKSCISRKKTNEFDKEFIEYHISQEESLINKQNTSIPDYIKDKAKEYIEWIKINYIKNEQCIKEKKNTPSPYSLEIIPNLKEEEKEDTSFRSLIQYEDKDKLLERLHFLIDPNPKKGSLIAAIIQKAYIDKYILELPNEATFRSEFKLDCTWEAVRKSFISTPYIKTSSSYIKMMQIKILD
ncbi:hypothetical protein [Bacteroides sp.]|uniref:hypothetical protein n=1 Tax=Bacteroides sp. TaxID=29523 RepID=UPI00258A5408|nr:hypothetical protein [Bacteroides sp.]